MSSLVQFAAKHFDDTSFEAVHRGILDLLPSQGAAVLDVGAGTGRDAGALASRGYRVTAVEPSKSFLSEAIRRQGRQIEWIEDGLPELRTLGWRRFDFVLVSAVWMYVHPKDRPRAISRLFELLADSGVLVISMRERLSSDDRNTFSESDPMQLIATAEKAGLSTIRLNEEPDSLGRPIVWRTVCLQNTAIRKVPQEQTSTS